MICTSFQPQLVLTRNEAYVIILCEFVLNLFMYFEIVCTKCFAPAPSPPVEFYTDFQYIKVGSLQESTI